MTSAPAAPDLDCYTPIVRSPRRRILQQLRQGIKTATLDQNFQTGNRESMHAGYPSRRIEDAAANMMTTQVGAAPRPTALPPRARVKTPDLATANRLVLKSDARACRP